MKKIIKSIFCICLAISFAFSFAGCLKEEEPEVDAADVNKPEEAEEIALSAEIEIYYLLSFYSTYNMSQSYDSTYGAGYGKMLTGYDASLSPSEQNTKNKNGETVPFTEYFYEDAISRAAYVKHYYQLAVDSEIELSDKNEVNNRIAEFKSCSIIKDWIEDEKISSELLRKIAEEQIYAELYEQFVYDQCGDSVAEIEKVYNENKTDYDVVSFRWFSIDILSTAVNGVYSEEAQAKAFIEKVKSESNYTQETFKKVVLETIGENSADYSVYQNDKATLLEKTDKSDVESNVSKDAADWLFETDYNGNYIRQSGELKYFVSADKEDVYILFVTGIPYRDETKLTEVRHILLEDSTYAEAQTILDDYYSEAGNGVDEDYFIELVALYSDDGGSKDSGGLISYMINDGQYISAFEDWVFAEGDYSGESREYGSVGIVESEYGYHIMFFVGCDEYPVWYENIRGELYDAELGKMIADIDVQELIGKEIDADTKESIMENCIDAIEKM